MTNKTRRIASSGLLVAYVVGIFGFALWIGVVFDASRAIGGFIVLFVPAVVGIRMLLTKKPPQMRDLSYLGIAFVMALVGTRWLVCEWFSTNREVRFTEMFKSEARHFDKARVELFRRVRKQPRFANVTLDYTVQKGGIIKFGGSVASQGDLDELNSMADELKLDYFLKTKVDSKQPTKPEPHP